MTDRFAHKKIGLLGGSFNPAHDGHRYISLQALRLLGLDEVWWLVSPLNPLKETNVDMAVFSRRLESAERTANHPRIRISSVESEIGTRYTVDTLEKLKEMHPQTHFVWLMGADNLADFHRWYRWKDIIRIVPIAVFARKNYTLKALHGKAGRLFRLYRQNPGAAKKLARMRPPAWVFLPIRRHPASSTEIRRRGLFLTGEESERSKENGG